MGEMKKIFIIMKDVVLMAILGLLIWGASNILAIILKGEWL
jgi:hypothetical protein